MNSWTVSNRCYFCQSCFVHCPNRRLTNWFGILFLVSFHDAELSISAEMLSLSPSFWVALHCLLYRNSWPFVPSKLKSFVFFSINVRWIASMKQLHLNPFTSFETVFSAITWHWHLILNSFEKKKNDLHEKRDFS